MKTNEYSKIYPTTKFFFRPNTESATKDPPIHCAETKELPIHCTEAKNSNDSTEEKNSIPGQLMIIAIFSVLDICDFLYRLL